MAELKTEPTRGESAGRLEREPNFVSVPRAVRPMNEVVNGLQLGRNLDQFLSRRSAISAFEAIAPQNVARGEAIDILVGPGRLLIYPATAKDTQAYQTLKFKNIPQFDRFAYPQNPDITLVHIPLSAWRLDSTDFPEEQPTFPAGSGAIELMDGLGKLLNQLKYKTGLLPRDFQLCNAAFVTGEADFIKLIPPYRFSTDVTFEELTQRVRHDLDSIDPANSAQHERQVQAFRTALLRKD